MELFNQVTAAIKAFQFSPYDACIRTLYMTGELSDQEKNEFGIFYSQLTLMQISNPKIHAEHIERYAPLVLKGIEKIMAMTEEIIEKRK